MAILDQVLYASSSDSTSHNVTLPGGAPADGTQLVLVYAADGQPNSGLGAYTSRFSLLQNQELKLLDRIASSDGATVTIGFATAHTLIAALYVIGGLTGSPPFDQPASNDPGGSPSSISTGTTPTLAQAVELAIAVFGYGTAGGVITGYTNSFVEDAAGVTSGSAGTNIRLAIAMKTTAATTGVETTATLTSSVGFPLAGVATYKVAASGGNAGGKLAGSRDPIGGFVNSGLVAHGRHGLLVPRRRDIIVPSIHAAMARRNFRSEARL
jgi:hypothetical protein